MERDLEGKTALVTGSARGMGRAIAERLAKAGALVAVLDAAPADDILTTIASEGGRGFHIRASVDSHDSAETVVASLEAGLRERTGASGLDILVNNIGGGIYEPFGRTGSATLDAMLHLNVRIPFLITKALADRMRDGGRIINISSAGSRIADPNFIAYGMAKSAIDYFTRALARELGPRGITVNAVGPGTTLVDSNLAALANPDVADAIARNTALGRIGRPDDIAAIVHMLASPAGRWMTAQLIDASGGYLL